MSPPGGAVIGVDVGGTSIRAAAFTRQGQLLHAASCTTIEQASTPEQRLLELLARLLSHLASHGGRADSIGLAVPGIVNSATGTVAYAANLGWRDLALADLVSGATGLSATVEQDARSAAAAEHHLSDAHERSVLVTVPIGTGISAACLIDGEHLRGASGAAGEFGHLQVVPGGRLCGCGQQGCVEAYASARGLSGSYRERTGRSATAQQVIDSIPHDPQAAEVWEQFVEVLSQGLVALTTVVDPSCITVGGGLSRAGEVLIRPLERGVASRLGWRAPPPMRLARAGTHAQLLGAATSQLSKSSREGFTHRARAQLGDLAN